MTPTITPTVVTDAWSNWRMTSAATHQAIPVTSQTHQRLAMAATAALRGAAAVVPPYVGAVLTSLPLSNRGRSGRRSAEGPARARVPATRAGVARITSRGVPTAWR